MAKFDVNKKGYDIEQVDNFINKLSVKYEEKLSEQKDRVFALKNELSLMEDKLNIYKDKDKQVSKALIFAVEKAEQIEANASKLYDLEIKRLRLLYKEWQDLTMKLIGIELPKNFASEIDKFNNTLTEVLEQNNRIGGSVLRKDLHNNSDGYIRNLLNKMDYAINTQKDNKAKSQIIDSMNYENEKETSRVLDLSRKLDRIKVKGSGNMAENYLNSDDDLPQSVYAKNITRTKPKKQEDVGFNLDDVLNPKEDLDEIMKAFDFFLENNPDDKNSK